MAIVVPAILEKTKPAFEEKVSLVTKIPGVQRIQVDFGDGIFVENKLLDISEISSLNPAFEWEAHLMSKEPSDFLDYQICGFKTLILHFEAFKSPAELMASLSEIKQMGFKTAIAINPQTPISALNSIEANQFLIMGVMPGAQGQTFIAATLEKVKQLRSLFPHAILEVDGGVTETNIKSIKDAGADLIVAGSAIVKAENPAAAFERLVSLVS